MPGSKGCRAIDVPPHQNVGWECLARHDRGGYLNGIVVRIGFQAHGAGTGGHGPSRQLPRRLGKGRQHQPVPGDENLVFAPGGDTLHTCDEELLPGGGALAGLSAVLILLRFFQGKWLCRHGRLYQIAVPQSADILPSAAEQLFAALHDVQEWG
jgi:hypothetical protein